MKTTSSFDENYFYINSSFVSDLKSIFEKKRQLSTQLSTVLKPAIIRHFETRLDLTYISEKAGDGNLCFAYNDEIRSEFKQTFTSNDLINYIFSFLNSQTIEFSYKIPYPKETQTFWELVKVGSEMS